MKKIIFNEQILNNTVSKALEKFNLTEKNIYNITLRNYFTEEELAKNKARYEAMKEHPELWQQECQKTRLLTANTVYEILEMLHKNFNIGQYRKDDYYAKYDLWFWCNSEGINHTIPTHTVGSKHYDLSYVTLAFDQRENVDKILDFLHNCNLSDELRPVQCTITYTLDVKTEKVIKLCELFTKNEITTPMTSKKIGEYYKCDGQELRLYKSQDRYVFKIKKQRTFYVLRNDRILDIIIQNNLLEKYVKLLQGETK